MTKKTKEIGNQRLYQNKDKSKKYDKMISKTNPTSKQITFS